MSNPASAPRLAATWRRLLVAGGVLGLVLPGVGGSVRAQNTEITVTKDTGIPRVKVAVAPITVKGEPNAEAVANEIRDVLEYDLDYSDYFEMITNRSFIADAQARDAQSGTINYGEWQGLSPDEVIAKWPAALEAWYKAPGVAEIPSGETLNAVRARGLSAVRELADLHEGATLVLVGHTVINRLILLAVLGLGTHRFWHIGQDTCAINVFETLGHDFILKSLNDTCHLHALAHN